MSCGGNDVIIFQHQYPGVAGAQLINHFVSGRVRYHIHTPQERRGAGRRRGEPVDHPDTPYLPRLPFTDHGSRITANNRDGRRMGQQQRTTISRPDDSAAPFRSSLGLFGNRRFPLGKTRSYAESLMCIGRNSGTFTRFWFGFLSLERVLFERR